MSSPYFIAHQHGLAVLVLYAQSYNHLRISHRMIGLYHLLMLATS